MPIFGSSLCSQKNDSLYYKLRCNVIATLVHWVHGIDEKSRESRSSNFQVDSYKFRKDCGCSKVPCSILPQNVSKKEENRKNSPKWAKVARKLHSVAKIARLQENAKVAQKLHTATSQFSGGTIWPVALQYSIWYGFLNYAYNTTKALCCKHN